MSATGTLKLRRFEDLVAWQQARELTAQIYTVTRQVDFARDFGLARQIQRAAVSIASNIAEGFERNSSAEFHQFLSTAKGSCAEVRTQLYIALDIGYLSQTDFERLLVKAERVASLTGALRSSIARRRAAAESRPRHG